MTLEAPLEETQLTVGEDRPDRLQRVPWGAVTVFIVTAFTLAWLVTLPLWMMDKSDPAFLQLFQPLVSIMMFTPTIAALVAVFVMRVPGKGSRLRFLGIWPLRPAKRVVLFTVGGIFGTILVVGFSVAVAALCGWIPFQVPVGMFVVMQLLAFPINAVFVSLFAVGEEIGWRGWLLPALRPLGVWPALILSGVTWGLWHSPVILLGYNFNMTDWRGVALMTVACTAWGVLLGWTRLRSGSVWPAVFGHGAMNASALMVVYFAAVGAPMNPVLVLPIGVAGWIAVAVVVLVLALTGQFRREPALTQRR